MTISGGGTPVTQSELDCTIISICITSCPACSVFSPTSAQGTRASSVGRKNDNNDRCRDLRPVFGRAVLCGGLLCILHRARPCRPSQGVDRLGTRWLADDRRDLYGRR